MFEGGWFTEYGKLRHVVDLDEVDTSNITRKNQLYHTDRKKVCIGDVDEGTDPLHQILGRGDPFESDSETVLDGEDTHTLDASEAAMIERNKSRAAKLIAELESQ